VNRSSCPGSVRYVSVTSVVQRRLLTNDDRGWHKARRPANPENPPVTGRFRWWWQVQGSNLGRLSRRFYRPFRPAHRNGCDLGKLR